MKQIKVLTVCLLLISLGFIRPSFAKTEFEMCKVFPKPLDIIAQQTTEAELPWLAQNTLCFLLAKANWYIEKEQPGDAAVTMDTYMRIVIALTPQKLPKEVSSQLLNSAGQAFNELMNKPVVLTGIVVNSASDPVENAAVTILFSSSGSEYSSTTDENGLFYLELDEEGSFVALASTESGALGSTQGGAVRSRSNNSVTISVEQSGEGAIAGEVYVDGTISGGSIVFLEFPETLREYATKVEPNGSFRFDGVSLDGGFYLSGFDDTTGANGSQAGYLTESRPEVVADIYLDTPQIINPELSNSDFSNELDGWIHDGDAKIVPAEDYFGDD